MKQYRILCFGDSITYGAWDSAGGWVDRLKRHFHVNFLSVRDVDKVVVLNLGVGGELSRGLAHRIAPEIEVRLSASWIPSVIIAAGINDTRAKGRPENYQSSNEDLINNLQKTITDAKRFVSRLLIVGLTPVLEPCHFKEYFYFNNRIKDFDMEISRLAIEHSIPYVPLFDDMVKKAQTKNLISDDLLHPNDNGHQYMFSRILPYVADLIH